MSSGSVGRLGSCRAGTVTASCARAWLRPARLIAYDANNQRFRVAVPDDAALKRWQSLSSELELGLGRSAHNQCVLEVVVGPDISPEPSVNSIAGAWSTRSPEELWQEALGQLKLEVNSRTYDTWLKETALDSSGPGVFHIRVLHSYAADWLNERLSGTIRKVASDVVGRPMDVDFVVRQGRGPRPQQI